MKSDILLSALIVSHTNAVLRAKKKIPFEAPALSGQYDLLFECAPHNFISKFRRKPITSVDDWVSYNTLSEALFSEIRMAVLYAANHT